MEKSFIEYNGKKYATRDVPYGHFEEGYGIATVADADLSNAFPEGVLTGEVEDQEVTDIDNGIYFYMDSGFVESDPTDAEIILTLLRNDNPKSVSDEQWYNLMRLATHEVNVWHEEGRTNLNIEGYEMGGEYSVYYYGEDVNHNLYRGKSAEVAAMTAVAFAAALNRGIIHNS